MEEKKKISFRQKSPTICPVCSYEFQREELFSGGGRLIAGKLTDELRRGYEDNKKFGKVLPLVYQVTVCPGCFYSAYHKDFNTLEPEEIEKLREMTPARKGAVKKFFGSLDFNQDRNLPLGAASYLLVVDCYSVRNKKAAPTFKNAVSSIRAAWLFGDMALEFPEKPYKKISHFFYKKAYGHYLRVLDLIQTGGEPADAAGNMGPDTDKNWGYDGILYVSAILTVKVGAKEADVNKRIENFEKSKRFLGRLFGMGKASKSKPGELLDKTKILYEKINEMLEIWEAEVKQKED